MDKGNRVGPTTLTRWLQSLQGERSEDSSSASNDAKRDNSGPPPFPPGNRYHLCSPHSPAIPNCISLSSDYLSETECARGDGGGGGDNEDDMILSGPARPKSEEEDGRTRTMSGSVRFDAWAFTPVGR